MTDLLLAIVHHLVMLSLAALLFAELVLVRDGMPAARLLGIARLDAFFGAFAGLMIVVGFLRVFLGAKPESYYLENLYFWTKIAAFLVVGVLSAVPTIRFARWARAVRAAPMFQPSAGEIRSVRTFLIWEALIFVLIPTFAAVMARYST